MTSPAGQVPVTMKSHVKVELDRLTDTDVITQVDNLLTEPAAWWSLRRNLVIFVSVLILVL